MKNAVYDQTCRVEKLFRESEIKELIVRTDSFGEFTPKCFCSGLAKRLAA